MKQNPYRGNHCWAPGYFVSIVCINEDVINRYVKHQEKEEKLKEEQRNDISLILKPLECQMALTMKVDIYCLCC